MRLSIKAWGRDARPRLAVVSRAQILAALLGLTACGSRSGLEGLFQFNHSSPLERPPAEFADPVALRSEPTGTLVCAATMQGAGAQAAVAPPADAAVVVFLRPSSKRPEIEVLIVDDDERLGVIGRFLGQSQASSYFTVTVAPGEHRFMAWADTAGALHATLAAGKKYYVEVTSDGDSRGDTRLSALAPSRKGWEKLPAWLAASTPLAPNEKRGQTCLTQHTRESGVWTERARTALRRYDPEELVEHTLRNGDGQ